MTDFTNNASLMRSEPKRQSKLEYRFYLSLIFMAALPFCTAIFAYRTLRHGKLPQQGPIQSALSEARSITPRIFWA